MMSEGIVIADGIQKTYVGGFRRKARTTALNDVTFSVRGGTIFALLGPNGAGKSTTIHLLLGFLNPTAGMMRVCGHDPRSPRARSSLGFLPEVFAFDRFLTGRRLLEWFDALAEQDPRTRRQRVDEVLSLVDLVSDADRKIGTYSKGMTQRIGLAQALLGDPELLILDEPMSGMDPASRRAVKDILLSRRTRGRTTMLSSHILADIEELADDVLILDHGRVVAKSSLEKLRRRSSVVRIVFEAVPKTLNAAELGELFVGALPSGDGGSFTLDCEEHDVNAALAALATAQVRILAVSPLQRDLESLFLELTEADRAPRGNS